MVFHIYGIKKKILSYLLIGTIEDKYGPYKNDNLENFCNKIVNDIFNKIIKKNSKTISSFYIVSQNNSLTLNITINYTFYNKVYILGKIILRKNNKVKRLKYILFNNKLKLNEFYNSIKNNLKEDEKYINEMKQENFNILIYFLRKKIYQIYST